MSVVKVKKPMTFEVFCTRHPCSMKMVGHSVHNSLTLTGYKLIVEIINFTKFDLPVGKYCTNNKSIFVLLYLIGRGLQL